MVTDFRCVTSLPKGASVRKQYEKGKDGKLHLKPKFIVQVEKGNETYYLPTLKGNAAVTLKTDRGVDLSRKYLERQMKKEAKFDAYLKRVREHVPEANVQKLDNYEDKGNHAHFKLTPGKRDGNLDVEVVTSRRRLGAQSNLRTEVKPDGKTFETKEIPDEQDLDADEENKETTYRPPPPPRPPPLTKKSTVKEEPVTKPPVTIPPVTKPPVTEAPAAVSADDDAKSETEAERLAKERRQKDEIRLQREREEQKRREEEQARIEADRLRENMVQPDIDDPTGQPGERVQAVADDDVREEVITNLEQLINNAGTNLYTGPRAVALRRAKSLMEELREDGQFIFDDGEGLTRGSTDEQRRRRSKKYALYQRIVTVLGRQSDMEQSRMDPSLRREKVERKEQAQAAEGFREEEKDDQAAQKRAETETKDAKSMTVLPEDEKKPDMVKKVDKYQNLLETEPVYNKNLFERYNEIRKRISSGKGRNYNLEFEEPEKDSDMFDDFLE